MATLYLRPTADLYSTHPRYPSDSLSVYTLLNEEVSDGASTYIDLSPSTTNTRETYSSSFVFAGVDFPLSEFEITDIYIGFDTTISSLYVDESLMTFSVSSNGITGISDVINMYVGFMSSTPKPTQDRSFDRNGEFLQMFAEYIHANGKLPDVTITVTTHNQKSKAATSYLTQLYLAIEYNAGVRRKTGILSWSKSNHIYKKVNGIWTEIQNGISQVGNRLNKKGHHHVPIGYVAPKCTDTGLTAGNKCSICGEIFEEREVIPAKGHNYVTVEASEATCRKEGYTGGERCSVCGEILTGEIIPMIEHTPVEKAATEPTCGAVGYTAGVQCSVCEKWLSGHETIPATGEHTWVSAGDGLDATDLDTGLIGRDVCSVCGAYRNSYVAIPMGGEHVHNYVAVPATPATCVSTGYTGGYKCSSCGHLQNGEIIPIDPNNHANVVTDAAVAATCTATGLTQGSHCTACGEVLVAQQTIPATGHTYVLLANSEECSVCGHVLRRFGIAYYGKAGQFDSSQDDVSATTVGNYALFGGGSTSSGEVNAYDASLTRTVPEPLYKAGSLMTATTVGNYALFGGGYYRETGSSPYGGAVDAYSTSLTRTTATSLSESRNSLISSTVGNYALFGGGLRGYSEDAVDAYNTSLTRSNPAVLSIARDHLAATAIGNYVLFGGGRSYLRSGETVVSTVDAYNTSLTRSIPTALSVARKQLVATTIGNYALFGGGVGGGTIVDAYNASLTRSLPTELSYSRTSSIAATTVGNYALFGGGTNIDAFRHLDLYDTSLTKTLTAKFTSSMGGAEATPIGKYALFSNGEKIVHAFINYDMQ